MYDSIMLNAFKYLLCLNFLCGSLAVKPGVHLQLDKGRLWEHTLYTNTVFVKNNVCVHMPTYLCLFTCAHPREQKFQVVKVALCKKKKFALNVRTTRVSSKVVTGLNTDSANL